MTKNNNAFHPIALRTRSNNPIVRNPLIHKRRNKVWIPATGISNFTKGAPIVDWFKLTV